MGTADSNNEKKEKCELLPPEGGWGYIIAIALILMINVTLMPTTTFGLVYGKFLSSIGDETTGTALTNCIFNTVCNITGLASSSLLQKYSYRVVALLGSFIFFIGSFSTIFVTTLPQIVISFGVIQGLGMGLMLPSFFTALNCYFDKRLNVVNNTAQSFMVFAGMIYPFVVQFLMVRFGFRGTVALISAVGLNAFVAAVLLQPVKWHQKKNEITVEKEELLEENAENLKPKARTSVVSLGAAVSILDIERRNQEKNWWTSLVKSMDLGMFKDPTYVNITLGLALGLTADVSFISILPMVLINSGFDSDTIAFLMFAFFASDLVARILSIVLSAVCNIKSRYYFLGSCFFLVVFRTAFVLRNDFFWKLVTMALVGFLRCFIQNPLFLVVAEEYPDNFASAFSLSMAVSGFVNFMFGPLMSFVKAWTHSDVMVVHLISLSNLVVVISWSLELILRKMRK